MDKQSAMVKAESNVAAQNGDAHAYDIPAEIAETVKRMVGRTFAVPDGKMMIVEQVGQNYVFDHNGDFDVIPASYFCLKIFPGLKAKEIK
jgi:hypothetical protein